MTTKHSKSGSAPKPVWFITGCSTGFGRELATQVLNLGYRTVVTARNPEDIQELATKSNALVLKLEELCKEFTTGEAVARGADFPKQKQLLVV